MFSDDINRVYFEESYFDSSDELFKELSSQMQLLTQDNYSVVVYQLQDEKGTYVLEYCSIGRDTYGEETKYPTWLSADEFTAIQASRLLTKLEDSDKKDKETEQELNYKEEIGKA